LLSNLLRFFGYDDLRACSLLFLCAAYRVHSIQVSDPGLHGLPLRLAQQPKQMAQIPPAKTAICREREKSNLFADREPMYFAVAADGVMRVPRQRGGGFY
jgi:hypothetical protein